MSFDSGLNFRPRIFPQINVCVCVRVDVFGRVKGKYMSI